MPKPVIFVVDTDVEALERAESELKRRYSRDYDIQVISSPKEGIQALQSLAKDEREVTAILASCFMEGMNGADFLTQAQEIYARARRGLLIQPADQASASEIVRAGSLGLMDAYLAKPTQSPDEAFHHVIADFLYDWSRENRHQFEFFKLIGRQWAQREHEIRDLLDRNAVPYGFYDVDSDEGQALLEDSGKGTGDLPVVIPLTGDIMVNPSNTDLAERLNVSSIYNTYTDADAQDYDLVIIGAGPAGLSAAVYGSSEGLRTLVIEREAIGGQAGTSSSIRNYLGFPHGVPGGELAERAYQQAWMFGTKFVFTQSAQDLQRENEMYRVILSDGSDAKTKTVLLAMGVSYRRLDIPSLEQFNGSGVYYGTAITESAAMRDQPVYIIGGGNSAGQAAIHLASYASHVTLLIRNSTLADSMSDYLIRELEARENVSVRYHCEVEGGSGGYRLEKLVITNTETGNEEEVSAGGLFVLIGTTPHTEWLPDSIKRDPHGYIFTGQSLVQDGQLPETWDLDRPPLLLETSLPGVFAAGDVRHQSVKRVASAVGEGSIAIQFVHQYLRDHVNR